VLYDKVCHKIAYGCSEISFPYEILYEVQEISIYKVGKETSTKNSILNIIAFQPLSISYL
jgi:hypothetical protein